MQVELDKHLVNGLTMTTQEKNHYDAFVEWDEVSTAEAREIVEMIRHLGLALDVKNLRANRKIITAGKKIRRAEEEVVDQSLRQELQDEKERNAVLRFCKDHPEYQMSVRGGESYRKFAEKNGIKIMTLASLNAWWACHKQEFILPPTPPPVVVAPGPDPNILEPLPPNLQRLEYIQTRRDVWSCPPTLFKFGMKFKEFVDRVSRIEREKR